MLMIKNILTEMKNSFLMCSEKKVGIAEERISVLENVNRNFHFSGMKRRKKTVKKIG